MLQRKTPLKAKKALTAKTPLKAKTGLKTKTPLKAKTELKAKTPLKAKTELKAKTQLQTKTPLKAKTELKAKTALKSNSTLTAKTTLKSNTQLKAKSPKKRQTAYKPKYPYWSIFTTDLTECVISHKRKDAGADIHVHHIFGAANKVNSEKYGFLVPLSAEWHDMSDKGIHFDRVLDLQFKMACEQYWLDTLEKTKEEFIEVFGKWWDVEE